MRVWLTTLTLLTTFLLTSVSAETTVEQAQVLKRVKKAERAYFEQHRLKPYLAAFLPSATWNTRRAKDDPAHVLTLDMAHMSALKKIRLKSDLGHKPTVYFNNEVAKVDGDTATVDCEIRRTFFGGTDTYATHYDLQKTKKGWKIAQVNQWLISSYIGGEPREYDEEYWKRVDGEADDKAVQHSPKAHISALINAHRFKEALAILTAEIEKKPTAEFWVARGELLIEFGQVKEARNAFKEAQKLEPSITPHVLLR